MDEFPQKPFSTPTDWFSFISKLNDRNLSRQRSSGFTSWALIGVMAWILNHVLIHIDRSSLINLTLWISFFGAISLFVFQLIFIYTIQENVAVTPRFMGKLSKKFKLFYKSYIVLILFCEFVISLIAFGHASIVQRKIAFLIICALFISPALLILVVSIRKRFVFGNKYPDVPVYNMIPNNKSKNGKRIVGLTLTSSLLLVIAISLIVLSVWQDKSLLPCEYIWIAAEINALFILGFFLLSNLASALKHSMLESIESRIVLEQLSVENIKQMYVDNVIGESTRAWLATITDELAKREIKVISQFESHQNDLDIVSQKVDHDTRCIRIENIKNEMERSYNNYRNYIVQFRKCYRYLLSQKAFSDLDEDYLKAYQLELLNKESKIIDMYRHLHKNANEFMKQ